MRRWKSCLHLERGPQLCTCRANRSWVWEPWEWIFPLTFQCCPHLTVTLLGLVSDLHGRSAQREIVDQKIVLVRFSSLWQNTWANQFKEGRIYFDSPFQRFQLWSLCPMAGPVVRQHMAEIAGEQSCSLMVAKKQRKREEEVGTRYTLQRHAPSNLLPPTKPPP
jgi:hypothetical protein